MILAVAFTFPSSDDRNHARKQSDKALVWFFLQSFSWSNKSLFFRLSLRNPSRHYAKFGAGRVSPASKSVRAFSTSPDTYTLSLDSWKSALRTSMRLPKFTDNFHVTLSDRGAIAGSKSSRRSNFLSFPAQFLTNEVVCAILLLSLWLSLPLRISVLVRNSPCRLSG